MTRPAEQIAADLETEADSFESGESPFSIFATEELLREAAEALRETQICIDVVAEPNTAAEAACREVIALCNEPGGPLYLLDILTAARKGLGE